MKTFAILAASLACAGAAPLADSETFKLIASAPGTPINARYLTVNNGVFYVGKETNSTCGNIAPVFEGGDAGWLAIFGDGKENQQQAFVDISGAADGAFSYSHPTDGQMNAEQISDKFERTADGDILYDGSNWLACPQAAGEYMIFADKAFDAPRDKCTTLDIQTKKVRTPKVACIFQ
ncbi:hypothetical protein DIS24_g1768 [Lasiodiplodia hormozganensis]|uniref:Cell wall protein PhiA n=1 Tax=Lasiodiplodia hormozganensis TaxID=869390 RepID=A0AA39Z2A4_9PEZI|nr:hypothetical protein DIS24_g1768 [Lasiodiplodia hormozganensis]